MEILYKSGNFEELSWPDGIIVMMDLCTGGWVPGYELLADTTFLK